jgi:hypothetical protein
MADAYTGKIIKKLSSTIKDNQIDDFNFVESGGSWSPDGKKFVFIIFSKGRNKLFIINVDKPNETEEISIPEVPSMSNPSWSPDGKTILVTGMVEGVTDIYAYDINTKKVTNLTKDIYANLQPAWSADGNFITFSTDRPSSIMTDSSQKAYQIAILNIKTNQTTVIPVFPGAENLNPQFSPDGKWLYFVSNADGFRNLYRYSLDSNKIFRLTNLLTGVCGITAFTPAYSVDRTVGNIVYTHYYNGKYNLYQSPSNDFPIVEKDPQKVDFRAGTLPPGKRLKNSFVNENINGIKLPEMPVDSFKKVPFKPKFKLDYIGNTGGIAVGVSSYYGTGMSGSVDMIFSDIVGQYQLISSLQINGEIYDFAGTKNILLIGALHCLTFHTGVWIILIQLLMIQLHLMGITNFFIETPGCLKISWLCLLFIHLPKHNVLKLKFQLLYIAIELTR